MRRLARNHRNHHKQQQPRRGHSCASEPLECRRPERGRVKIFGSRRTVYFLSDRPLERQGWGLFVLHFGWRAMMCRVVFCFGEFSPKSKDGRYGFPFEGSRVIFTEKAPTGLETAFGLFNDVLTSGFLLAFCCCLLLTKRGNQKENICFNNDCR